MRITDAARELGVSARMLRYREALGLLPDSGTRRIAGDHRQYEEADLRAVRRCLILEQRYGITPATLAFALRALTEPGVAAQVRALGQQLGRAMPQSVQALDFEQRRALRWLDRAPDRDDG